MASGLQINLHKSKIYVIGVSNNACHHIASYTTCAPYKIHFLYLGLQVGERMHRVSAWNKLIDQFRDKLSLQKSMVLSIGGRLMLVMSVPGSLGIYYLSLSKMLVVVYCKLEGIRARLFQGAEGDNDCVLQWVKWDVILNDKQFGGLGVGSLAMINQALIYNCRWRFLNDEVFLWVRLVKSCYGNTRGFLMSSSSSQRISIWKGWQIWCGMFITMVKFHLTRCIDKWIMGLLQNSSWMFGWVM